MASALFFRAPLCAALLVTSVLLGASCRTTSMREVSSASAPSVRTGKRARTWEVRSEGAVLGLVVLFEDGLREQDSVYVVRNPWNQDLGLIDGLGRAFRYVPHREEPSWVGSGTIAVGAQHIFGTNGACELIEQSEPETGPHPGTIPASAEEHVERGTQQPSGSSDAPPSDDGLPQSR